MTRQMERQKAQVAFDAVCAWLEDDLDFAEAQGHAPVEASWTDPEGAYGVGSDLLDRLYCAGPLYGDDERMARAQRIWERSRECGRYFEL